MDEYNRFNNIYYFDCKMEESIFQGTKRLEVLSPGCRCVRKDIVDSSNNICSGIEYSFAKKSLTKQQKKVFKKWIDNSKHIQLELLSYNQAIRSSYYMGKN